jgi:hypothetical protein
LVLPDAKPDAKADAQAKTFRIVAIYDPRYQEPLLLATTLSVSASALWHL